MSALTVALEGQATVKQADVRSGRRPTRASARRSLWTTEQLLGQPKTWTAPSKSGEPLFCGVWSEDEIRSVEGPGCYARNRFLDAAGAAPKEPPLRVRFYFARSMLTLRMLSLCLLKYGAMSSSNALSASSRSGVPSGKCSSNHALPHA